MRAKTINEINFERTGDSLDKLQLGQDQIIKYKLFNELSKLWEPKYIEDLSDDDWIYFKINPGEIDHYISFYNGTFQIGSKENGWDENFGIRRGKKNIDEVLQKAISVLDDKTKYNQFRKKVLENFNFERTGNSLDKLKIGRVEERLLRKKSDEIKFAIEEVHKSCPTAEKIKNIISESIIHWGFKRKSDNMFFYIRYYIKLKCFATGWMLGGIGENKADEIEYDTLEECVNKLKWWIINLYKGSINI
ncbi:MAG: hypothetical protein PHF86_01870 [Candidatus Nanoarchaeia archaeon]|nr:hypothetical protein [Candidatus Nanoarchaeia archaeon]